VPAKLLGIALILAGLLLRRGIVRALNRGYVGSRHRRIHRDPQRLKFTLALSSQAVGALICFIGAYLCISGALSHHF
jgi:hypothetical protein